MSSKKDYEYVTKCSKKGDHGWAFHAFINSFSLSKIFFWRIYYVPSTFLGGRDTAVK